MVTIIFVHQGVADCLFLAAAAARHTHPEARIVLLGDRSNAYLAGLAGIEHVPVDRYRLVADEGLKDYFHLSTNGEEFERICLARWFILLAFLEDRPEIESCVYLDSDILVFDDLSTAAERFSGSEMTMLACSAHTNFLRGREGLRDYCRLVRESYGDENGRSWLRSEARRIQAEAGGGGVSDMTFFCEFRRRWPERIATIHGPFEDDAKGPFGFDETIDSGYGGYETENGLKKLEWREGMPWCRHLDSGQDVRMLTLHYQGPSKWAMASHCHKLVRPSRTQQFFHSLSKFRNRVSLKARLLRRAGQRRLAILFLFSPREAMQLMLRRITGQSTLGEIPRDEFVAADTIGYVLARKGDCLRVGSANRISFADETYGAKFHFLLRRGTTDFHVFNQVFRSREYAPMVDIVSRLESSGPLTIIDAGANIGCSSVWLASLRPESRVIALEIENGNFQSLVENVRLNQMDKQILPLRVALWNREEMLSITDEFRDGREYAFSVKRVGTSGEGGGMGTVCGLPVSALREKYGLEKIDVLKIDIEGAEKAILEDIDDAHDALSEVRTLALEIHDDVASRERIEANLTRLGFEWFCEKETLFAYRGE